MRAKKIDNLQELERKHTGVIEPLSKQLRSNVEPTTRDNRGLTRAKADYEAQKAAAAEKRKKEKQIAEVEAAIAALEAQQAEMEQLLSSPNNQTAENFQKYESVKHQIEQKLYEWEILNDEGNY